MNTNTRFLSYRARFLLDRGMLQATLVEKIKTHILCSATFFFRKSFCLCYNVEKYCAAERSRPQMTICRMRIACWISMATHILTTCNIIACPLQQLLHERSETARPVTAVAAADNTESRAAVYRTWFQVSSERPRGPTLCHHLTCECHTWLCLHNHRAVKAASGLPCLLRTTDFATFLYSVYHKSSCISKCDTVFIKLPSQHWSNIRQP
jgi:hypothetical protein